MSEWKSHRLGDFLTLEYGKPLDKGDRKDDGLYPAYGANGVKCRSDKFYCENETIIVGRKGSAGELTLTEERFWPLDVTYFVKFDQSKYDLTFIYYLLSQLDLPSLATGVKPGINRNNVYSIGVRTPSIPEQQRIVAILDQAFADIEKTRANAEQNLKNARELFDSYLNQVFGQRGEGWVETHLASIAENLDSRRVPITKSERIEGEYPYYGASGIVDYVSDFLFDEELLLISEDGANLLARTYPIAFSALGKYWVNNHAHVLRFRNSKEQKFIEYYLNSISLAPFVSGMAQPKLNQKSLNSIPVPMASPNIVDVVVGKLNVLVKAVEKLEVTYKTKLSSLSELKQSLLQKAFSGELTKGEGRAA